MGKIPAGSLNQRITLVSAGVAISDGRGGRLATADQDVRPTLYARVRQLSTREKFAIGQVLNADVIEVTIRKTDQANPKQRLEWNGQTYNIQGVTPDEHNEYLLLTCVNSGQ